MTWFVNSTNESEAAKEHVHMFIAVSMDFSSAFLRVWSGYGDMTIGGFTYTGIGTMGAVTIAPEHTRLLAERKQFRLSGVDPSILSEADIDASFGRSVAEYFGFISEAGLLVAAPETSWEGRIDSISRLDSDSPYIEVSAENRMVLLDQPNGWRYTHEHQQQFFAGDDGLKLIPTTMTSEVLWGGSKVVPGSGPSWHGIPGAKFAGQR